MEFRTVYARPGRLRFEERHLRANGDWFAHRIRWADGDDVRWWSRSDPSLTPATNLPGEFGMAAIAVHPLLGLLAEGQIEGWLSNLTGPILLDDADLDGDACHRVRCRCSWWDHIPTPEEQAAIDEGIAFLEQVSGMHVPPGRTVHLPLTLWIDRRTLLIRRVESGTITDRARREDVMTCQPELGVTLCPAESRFDAPDPPVTSEASGS